MITTTIFPGRYVQGAGALNLLPQELTRLGQRALAIVDPTIAGLVEDALSGTAELRIHAERFGGECCDPEIERLCALARKEGSELIVGLGGGKAIDTAKAVAHTLGTPVVVVPTLASTDAPCSALSVIYTPQGAFSRYLVLPRNPDVVLVDSALIARAPVRFLVSGMGDALSTWFEAEDCRTKKAPNMTGRPGSITAYGLARLCHETLMEYGLLARRAVEQGVVTPAVEHIVEANTLLSGLGFESGGLSGAHAIHNGLTMLEETHAYWHGEKVAIGTLALLFLSDRPAPVIKEAFDFCEAVGLPITLAQIGLDKLSDEQLLVVGQAACAPEDTMGNVPHEVGPAQVVAALRTVDAEGRARLARGTA